MFSVLNFSYRKWQKDLFAVFMGELVRQHTLHKLCCICIYKFALMRLLAIICLVGALKTSNLQKYGGHLSI